LVIIIAASLFTAFFLTAFLAVLFLAVFFFLMLFVKINDLEFKKLFLEESFSEVGMIEKVRKIVEQSHEREDFQYPVLPVVKNALFLARKLNADLEVVETAALLHDIGRSRMSEFEVENEHNFAGAKKASEVLKGFGCRDDFIEKVAHCILTHRGRSDLKPESLEAEIIANADAMTHFDTFLNLLKEFFGTNETFEAAVLEIERKMERNWGKKLSLPEAKEKVREKFEAVMLLIKSMKEEMKTSSTKSAI